jgi:branched-chain amino acid transport system substrate-binding protein
MHKRIGLLLPRSTDYPSMGVDILDGMKGYTLNIEGNTVDFKTENTGFGENPALTYEKAEKLLLEEAVDVLVTYSSATNAELLYNLAPVYGKPLVFLDAGMQMPLGPASPSCYHISLQGLHACRTAGAMAGEGNRKVLLASSFYDGGYLGPWAYDKGLSEAGGAVCANYVSGYKEAEFTIDPYISLLQSSDPASVAACFSSYLAKLFLTALGAKNKEAIGVPFYCAPFMAEEQMLGECVFPGGDFYTVVPWATTLQNDQQSVFSGYFREKKKKTANIFHLLGWEAGIVVSQILKAGDASLPGFTYSSPRGQVAIHPGTHYTYAPLYHGRITGDGNGRCRLEIGEATAVSAGDHERMMSDKPSQQHSGWRNNYLCI